VEARRVATLRLERDRCEQPVVFPERERVAARLGVCALARRWNAQHLANALFRSKSAEHREAKVAKHSIPASADPARQWDALPEHAEDE
jgi:hypothetical protein